MWKYENHRCQSPLPHRGRVALLTIAERQIEVNFPQNASRRNPSKLLIQSAKTMAEWIRLNRKAKYLTQGQLGARMGIARAVVSAWEDGAKVPEGPFMAALEQVFGQRPEYERA